MVATGGTILITGAGGFLGANLAAAIAARHPAASLVLSDIVETPRLAPLKDRASLVIADITDPFVCRDLVSPSTELVYHLASLVSGGAETDFEAGLKANVFATIHLLEACRLAGGRPRFVFASSIATFGGDRLPEKVDDWTFQHPQNSYGVAKLIGEQLLNDYSRKGYVDGRGLRMPAVVVRDVPNTAVSGYASNLIREPLEGRDYVCPVSEQTRIPILGVETAIRLLVALGGLNGQMLSEMRTVNGPSISPSAAEIAAAVRELASPDQPVGKITFSSSPQIQAIVDSWPRRMAWDRARALGLPEEQSIQGLVEGYVLSRRRSAHLA